MGGGQALSTLAPKYPRTWERAAQWPSQALGEWTLEAGSELCEQPGLRPLEHGAGSEERHRLRASTLPWPEGPHAQGEQSAAGGQWVPRAWAQSGALVLWSEGG